MNQARRPRQVPLNPHPQAPGPNYHNRRRRPPPAPTPYVGHFEVNRALDHYITKPSPPNHRPDPNQPHWTDIYPIPPHQTHQGHVHPILLGPHRPGIPVVRLSDIPGALHNHSPYTPLAHAKAIARAFRNPDQGTEAALREANGVSWARRLGASETEIEAASGQEGGLEELIRAKMKGPGRRAAGAPRLGSYHAALVGVPGSRISFH